MCLQHQYIGEAIGLVAPMYWCIRKGSDMFVAHSPVVKTLPISWRERIRKYVFPRWQTNYKRKENLSSRSHTTVPNICLLQNPTHYSSVTDFKITKKYGTSLKIVSGRVRSSRAQIRIRPVKKKKGMWCGR
jgi:hypothetical protein